MKEKIKKKYRQTYRNIIKHLPCKVVLNIENLRGYHKFINFKHPKYFGEKIQWLKVYGNLERYTDYADKYKVREYISKKIGEQYLIPLLQVCDKPEQIDYDSLPDKFVIKLNTGSGYNIIIDDKNIIDKTEVSKKLNKWLKEDYYKIKKEVQYKNIDKKILCEGFVNDQSGQLLDYKFFCFDGSVEFVQVDYDRFGTHMRNFYDRNGNLLDLQCGDYLIKKDADSLPNNYSDMIRLSQLLSKDFRFVRVDLYDVDEKIYFGELTFTPTGGLKPFKPIEKDIEYAKKIKVSDVNEKKN